MPGFADEALAWRKRKRENEDPLTRPASFVPFMVDHANCDPYIVHRHNHNHSHEQSPDKDFDFRPRCIPRKRRHLQQLQLQQQHPHQQHPQHSSYLLTSTPQPSLLSPNIYATPQDPYSPPVSPKTLVPIPYPSTTPTSAPSSATTTSTTHPSALRPCHICHRRPTTRQVLDAYADCDLCAQRACYICLRLCDGSSCPGAVPTPTAAAHAAGDDPYDELGCSRRKICSSCAVEGVSEGVEIVRCLDCVRPAAWEEWALDGDERMGG
ncbi:hypothetical protein N7509_014102 [Penicillium cosmopolitanum]|uniref:Uncharacterized protein n=1 Tax=Penicillium cosmopolitanum TaxID=1131564 RepID=A0A9W9V7Q1_9EURO|nr:uncharacterized protein N7509_014102 [Penicillium cosmopolitanum]KAJ5369490.1 hypothetical protein N7509_014102 [Penicillium cosmopolitanum]